jgi:predicted dehydrogenase
MTINRRNFLKQSTLAAAGAWTLPRFAIGKPGAYANNKLNVACVGIGHMGNAAVQEGMGENLVALCDVDWRTDESILGDRMPAKNAAENPQAQKFTDFRSMLDKVGNEIDVVLVSTPDHTHFPVAMASMELGKPVFVQKPLAHNIWQVRTLRKAMHYYGVDTVMGNQGHTTDGIRYIKE